MKRHILSYIIANLLFTLVALFNVVSAHAQDTYQYALYNYRNDGDFNAWLNIDIDSITFSRIDTLGIEHDDVVVQEVWTPDSVYRIPLEVIDSIGFRAPKTEYQDDVFHITVEHLPYISAVNDLKIVFLSTLPENMRPKAGQVVTSDTFDDPLSSGFAGRVTKTESNDEYFTIVCEEVNVTDIFKKLVIVGKATAVEEGKASPRPSRKYGEYYDHAEFEFPGEFSVKISDFVTIKDKVSMSADYYVYVDVPRFKLRFTVTGTHDLKTSWTLDSDKIMEWITGKKKEGNEPDWATPFWPIVAIPGVFSFGVKAGGFLDPSVKLSLTGTTPLTFTHTFGVEFSNTDQWSWIPLIKPIVDVDTKLGTPDISLSLEGKLFTGVAIGLKAKLVSEKVLHGDITGRFGPEFDAKIQMKQMLGDDDKFSWYSLLKDSKIGVQAKVDAKIKATAFFNTVPTDKLKLDWKWPIEGWESTRYLFPEFTKPELCDWKTSDPLAMFTTPSRDIIMPVQIGIGLFDENGVNQRESFCDGWYLEEKKDLSVPTLFVGDLPVGSTYTCRPIFNFAGITTVYAEPRETFTVPEPIHASPKEVKLSPGESAIVEILGGWHDYGVAIDYQDIASIVKDETTDATHIKVMGLTNGNATLTIRDQRTKEIIDVPIIVTDDIPSGKTCPDDHHPHLIDLGLPSGTKWSCCNVGADTPEGFGGYYAWGETKAKSEYTWNTYKYGKQDSDGRWHGKDLGSNIGATDYDAAYAEWGREWAIPSVDQIQEMLGYCTSEWTTVNGVEGQLFTSRINGGTIFLPASGYRFGTEVRDSGSNGYYWSDTQSTNFDSYAYDLTFSKGDMGWGDFSRYIGLTIRPVNAPK